MLENDQISFRPTLADLVHEWVCAVVEDHNDVPVLGLSGAQGIGKTTSLERIRNGTDMNVAVLSLDDFYLPKAERTKLADTVHPLCETRGVPGTHDLDLLKQAIARLKRGDANAEVKWPSFNKVTDDRSGASQWNSFAGRPDAILVEGWLVGALGSPEMTTDRPINDLEAEYDSKGLWRAWQFDELRLRYEPFWAEFEAFLHLKAPNFEVVHRWRCEQEEASLGFEKGTLSEERRQWVRSFIQYYERLTKSMLSGQHTGGMVFELDEHRSVRRLINH